MCVFFGLLTKSTNDKNIVKVLLEKNRTSLERLPWHVFCFRNPVSFNTKYTKSTFIDF